MMKRTTPAALILLLAPLIVCAQEDRPHQHELGDDPYPAGRVVRKARPVRRAGSRPADKVMREGGWELRITYRHKGTRSEGQDGVLLHDGKVVAAGSGGEVLETPLGRMKYYGGQDTKKAWEPSGWNFADETKIKRWGPRGADTRCGASRCLTEI